MVRHLLVIVAVSCGSSNDEYCVIGAHLVNGKCMPIDAGTGVDTPPPIDAAQGVAPGNVLVTALPMTVSRMNVVTPAGSTIATFAIPMGAGDGPARGVVVDGAGNVQIFNGTFTPVLTTLTVVGTRSFADHAGPAGWSTANDVTYGAVAVAGTRLFATDMATAAPGAPNGLISFDTSNGFASTRFGSNSGTPGSPIGEYIDVTVGLDGKLYALGPGVSPGATTVDVFDATTMAFDHAVTLATIGSLGIAVDSNGDIFATFGDHITRFDSTGAVQQSLPTGTVYCADIDIDTAGKIVAGCDHLIFTDRTLATSTSIDKCMSPYGCFVAWTKR
jgi:hypothetical protein